MKKENKKKKPFSVQGSGRSVHFFRFVGAGKEGRILNGILLWLVWGEMSRKRNQGLK